jgi:hypothetical protein
MIHFFATIESEQTSMFPTPQQQQQQQFPAQQQVYNTPSFGQAYPQSSTQQFPQTGNQQFFPAQQQSFQSYTPQQQFTSPQQPI